MSILVRDLRTIWSEFDAGGAAIDGEGGNNTKTVFTADPSPIEGTGSVGRAVGAETLSTYVTSTSVDVSNSLIYGWFLTSPPVANTGDVDPGIGILVGDGTNRNGYGLAGADKAGFRHSATNPDWQAIVLDTTVAAAGGTYPTPTTDLNGGNGVDPNFATATEMGYFITRLAAARGNVENSFHDIMRYGLGGIQILGDSANSTTSLSNIDSDGRSGGDLAAYASVRQVGANAFSIMSLLNFGDSANGNRGLNFVQQNSTLLWEDIILAQVNGTTVTVPRMRLISSGPTSAPTLGPAVTKILFGNRTGDGTGNNGCTFVTPVEVDVDFTNQNVDSVGIYGSVFRDFYKHEFRQDKTVAASKHEIFQTDFIGCGSIYVGGVTFKNNSIFGSSETGADSAAVHLIQTDNVSGLFFTSPGTGHAISIDSATPNQSFTFNNFTYSGYASITGNTGNEVLINNSGQPITVQVSGGDDPTVDSDGVRGRVTIVNNITTTISGVLGNSEIKVLPTSGSPYSGNSLNDTLNITTETVSANTFVGDGTNYLAIGFGHANDTNQDGSETYSSQGFYTHVGTTTLNPEGTFVFSNFPGVLQDTNSTSPRDLVAGDLIRITPRDDNVNPTLQNFVTAEVVGTPAASSIPILSGIDDGIDFTIILTGGGTQFSSVSLGNIKPSYEFTGTVFDGFGATWSTSTTNCTVTPSSGNSGDTFTITFSATGAFSAGFSSTDINGTRSVTLSGTVVEESRNVVTWKSFVNLG
jgi:hypothetical protein